jgi:hypothetical protein
MPKAARERVTSPRAGAALAPNDRVCLPATSFWGEIRILVLYGRINVNNCLLRRDNPNP